MRASRHARSLALRTARARRTRRPSCSVLVRVLRVVAGIDDQLFVVVFGFSELVVLFAGQFLFDCFGRRDHRGESFGINWFTGHDMIRIVVAVAVDAWLE